jgi:hypothetical protein
MAMAKDIALLVPPAATGDEATGRSPRLNFDEAFASAIGQLPALQPAHPDTLETVRVVEIGALLGGIGGVHELYVRVRRTRD